MNREAYKVHYLQHVPFEGLGYIETWVREKGCDLSVTKLFEEHQFPDLKSFDLLIIMGGPMGVYEEDKYLWLAEEKFFIKKAIDAGKCVLGICLGSQLIAASLGAKVYPNLEKEIGWLPITFTDDIAQKELFDSKEKSLFVFQWHGDTFDLPQNAKLLASSNVCCNQAFLYNNNVLGLQFHFEVTEASCSEMLENGIEELVTAPYIQSANYIRTNMHYITLCNHIMNNLLNKLTNLQ